MIVPAEHWHAKGRPNAAALLNGERPSGHYAGLLIGALKRSSTKAQVENWRSKEQEDTALRRLADEGAVLVLYDEQGVSGRVLAKRATALSLLDDIGHGYLDGLFAYDVKRLTRDEYGADAGTIAQRMADARAVLVTSRQDYRLWLPNDITFFRIEASLAGREVIDIRDTLYGGMLTRARHEPFFRSTPPYGYTTQLVEVPPSRAGQPTRIRRTPRKDPAAAEAMVYLVEQFELCLSLSDVAHAMNAKGYRPEVRKGVRRGIAAVWDARRIRYMLDNPIYYGKWQFGRTIRKSPMWDTLDYREERLEHQVPELAYWTRAQARGWLAKFGAGWRSRGPQKGYSRPLKGTLVCVTCGRVMLSSGSEGYQCPLARYGPSDRCQRPQQISHKNAMRLLAAEFPRALKAFREYEPRLRARLAAPSNADTLRQQVAATRERMDRLYFDYYKAPDRPAVVPRAVKEDLASMEQELERLEAQAGEASESVELTAAAAETLATLAGTEGIAEKLAAHSEAEQAYLFRLLFAEVKIRAEGWGSGRKYALVSYRNLLTEETVEDNTAISPYASA